MHFLVVEGAGLVRVGISLSPNGLRACLTACSQTPFPASQPPPFLPICHFGFVPVCSREGSSAYTCKPLSHNDIVTRHYCATLTNSRAAFLSICTTRRIYKFRHCWRVNTAGEERVRVGKGPRRIIGKKREINEARVL